MDVDELHSDVESRNSESDDEFDMNSEEDNDSGSLNISEVVSYLILFVYAPMYYNMTYLVAFLGCKFLG